MKFNKTKKILYGKDNEANASRSNYVGDTYVGWKNFSFCNFSTILRKIT